MLFVNINGLYIIKREASFFSQMLSLTEGEKMGKQVVNTFSLKISSRLLIARAVKISKSC